MMSLPVMDSTPPSAKDSTHSAKDSTAVCCSGGGVLSGEMLSLAGDPTINERTVRILLECFLDDDYFCDGLIHFGD